MDSKNGLESIGQILSRMVIGGRKLVPNTPQGPCALCGNETSPADSLLVDGERQHYTCSVAVCENGDKRVGLSQDFLRHASALSIEPILYKRLRLRLKPYVDKHTVESFCRMITFCIDEIRKDPSIRTARKQYLSSLFSEMRSSYIPTLN